MKLSGLCSCFARWTLDVGGYVRFHAKECWMYAETLNGVEVVEPVRSGGHMDSTTNNPR